jgi:glycosyltransferase involved in cell wall biosynthesis
MIRNRIIVCIASRWDFDPTSKHQVMRILARENQIVWVNHHGTRRPRATAADIGASLSTLGRALRGVRTVGPNMVHVTPLVVPGIHHGRLPSVNRRLLVTQIRRALRAIRGRGRRPIQLWTYAPDVWFVAGALGEERVVYCCVDEYSEFEGVNRSAVQAAERRLIERADVVITTSAALYESKRRLHPNTHLVRHGVDVAHFARALDDSLPEPADLAAIRRPILGFFGLIHHWIDCDLIVRVARQRPNLSFVLIGSNRSGHPGLTETPNIHLLGRREYARLPAYCKAFDAALLPFVCNRMTLNINPIKLREYLAAGLPVVSTPLPEAARYQPHVQIARDPDDFARACDAAITHSSPKERRQRARCVADETWEAVVEKLSRLVTDPSGRPAACAPAAALTG